MSFNYEGTGRACQCSPMALIGGRPPLHPQPRRGDNGLTGPAGPRRLPRTCRRCRNTMASLLIRNATVVTLGGRNRILPNHSVLIEGDCISTVAPAGELSGTFADDEIDGEGKLVMPGFINAHTHFYSAFARGLSKVKASCNFVEVLENLWWRIDRLLTPEDCYYSALVSCIDAVRHGTTTLIDHHASQGHVRGTLAEIERAVRETGLRACLCFELTDRDGPETAAEGLAENIEFIGQKRREDSSQIRALFGLHAAFTLTDETLQRAVEEAAALDVGFHIHTAEDLADQEHSLKEHGIRVVERLHRMGVLGRRTICAHCLHVDDGERDLLRHTDTMAVHLAQSNLNNAVGIADVIALVEKGVLVGIGTDSMTNDMIEETRVALWGQKINRRNPSVGFMEILNALVVNNAKIVGRIWGDGIGEIRPGYKADVVLIDYPSPTPFDEGSFLGHLGYGLGHCNVSTTIAAGKVLMRDYALVGIDEVQIAARATELSRALWARF